MSAATVQATTAMAMHAVAGHVVEHGLPAPLELSAPRAVLRETRLRVYIDGQALDAWTHSVTVEEVRVEAATVPGWERVTVDALVPAAVGDVRIRLHAARPATGLFAVRGGAA